MKPGKYTFSNVKRGRTWRFTARFWNTVNDVGVPADISGQIDLVVLWDDGRIVKSTTDASLTITSDATVSQIDGFLSPAETTSLPLGGAAEYEFIRTVTPGGDVNTLLEGNLIVENDI